MLKKKSIVLSDTEGSNQKAVLSLEEDGLGVRGTVRLYNFSHELAGVSSLGFYVDQKVYKAGLTFKSHMLYDFFIDLKEIPNKFTCAVVNFQNAVARPILYGSSDGNNDDIYGSIISELSNNNTAQNAEKVLDKYGVDFDDEEKKVIEKEIDDAMCDDCKACSNCVYKKYFFENQTETQSLEKDEVVETPQAEAETELFFDKLKPQIDKLFQSNPIEDNLQSIIPNSKWVKVDYEDDGDFYVFGLLYDDQQNVRYVCYGVPAVFEEEPPKELSGYPIWLPLDKENVQGFGYWLTYQDAATGEPIKAILD